MADFFTRYYRPLLTGLILILMVLSFLIGREEGLRLRDSDAVILSCNPVENVLGVSAEGAAGASLAASAAAVPVPAVEQPTVPVDSEQITKEKYMGSKNGTKYYTPGCPGSLRIKPENYVWFIDEEDATVQGYSKGSC